MNVILTGKNVKNRIVEVEVNWLIKELRLQNSRATLEIIPKRGLVNKLNCRGLTGHLGDVIGLVYDGSAEAHNLIRIIAHEMVHVKQIAKGQLKYKINGEDEVATWLGKRFELDGVKYIDRPWEYEAYSKQEILALKFEDYIDDLRGMNKNERTDEIRRLSIQVP